MMKTNILALFALMIASSVSAAGPELQTGDLVFQTSSSPQSKVIQIASGSPFSHVGIVQVGPGGQAKVIEAISTVSITPLSAWVQRGGGRYAVYRLSGLSEAKAQEFVAAAQRYLGRGYDIFFTSLNDEIYCSELVDYAARDVGLHVGSYQALGSLNVNNPTVMGLIQQRWRGHPLCRGVGSFEACWSTIQNDELITPVSLTRDPGVRAVWSNY